MILEFPKLKALFSKVELAAKSDLAKLESDFKVLLATVRSKLEADVAADLAKLEARVKYLEDALPK
jgi:hypothetical protein